MSGFANNQHQYSINAPSPGCLSKSHSEAMLVKAYKIPQLQNATPVSLKNGHSIDSIGAGSDTRLKRCHHHGRHRYKNGCLSVRLRHHHHHHQHSSKHAVVTSASAETFNENEGGSFHSLHRRRHQVVTTASHAQIPSISTTIVPPTASSPTTTTKPNVASKAIMVVIPNRGRRPKSAAAMDSGESGESSLMQSFRTYCEETSLHGWKYVQTSSNLEKFAWLALLILALTTASVLVYRAISDFLAHTVSTNMDSLSTTYDNLYFPAITVCNMNFMQRSVLEKYNIQNNDTLIDVFDRMINTGSREDFTEEERLMFADIERMTNGSAKLKMEGQPECHNMFLQYYWKNRDVPFIEGQTTMHYQQTTDESVCCQIFPGMLQEENHNKFDVTNVSFWLEEPNPWQIIFDGYKKGIKPGKQGVEVLIDVETYEYFSVHSAGSEGVLVLIQHYRDIPLMRKESFVLAPGNEADVGLSITEIITSQSAIKRFAPIERDCYTHDEVNLRSLPLKKGYRMSMKNCLYDKALHATKAICGCKPPFYVLGVLGNLTTCQGTQLDCAYRIFDDPNNHFDEGTEKTCLAPCNDQIYDSRITLAGYPNRAMFAKRPEICSVVRKLLKICQGWVDPHAVMAYGQYGDELKIKKNVLLSMYPNICNLLTDVFGFDPYATTNISCSELRRELQVADNSKAIFEELYRYAKENLLWLNVYIKDSFATRIIRDERMTRTSFVANVGGLLGLCMGFSLVSVAEILYFCFKRNNSTWSLRKLWQRPSEEGQEAAAAATNSVTSTNGDDLERQKSHDGRVING